MQPWLVSGEDDLQFAETGKAGTSLVVAGGGKFGKAAAGGVAAKGAGAAGVGAKGFASKGGVAGGAASKIGRAHV